ncbi:MAG: hypothetical protein RLZZ245_3904 [Verrucomicrobiota bacterium]
MKITHQIGDRVKVLHNILLGNLIGTVKAIHSRPKHDVYDVELDGGGTDSLYAEQLERITDTPETDAVREMWLITPNVELGDGRPIHGNVVDVEFARRMERERNEAREAYAAETQSTIDMTKRIIELEGCLRTEGMRIENLKADRDEWKRNCIRNQSQRDEWKASVKELEAEGTRLHGHWTAAEERANVAEARLKDRDERLRKLSHAASVLWEEHKAFGEDVHDTEGVDFLGSDSEGHALMQALVDETLSSVSCQNV